MWMADHTRYGRGLFSYPSDSLEDFRKYGIEKYFYIEKEKYYKSEIKILDQAISELESDLETVQSSYLYNKGYEELESLKYERERYAKKLLEVQNHK